MNQILSPLQVVCRPALERDREDIKEFCKTIWNGQDYVPDVMDDWLRDREGIFAVAEYEGHAIACSKITLIVEKQWWLEGFRVDPKYQGLKVGSLMHHYVDQWWVKHGDGILRLMTNFKNKSVHHLCENTGFTNLFEMRGYKAEPFGEVTNAFISATPSERDLERVVEFMSSSPSLALTDRLVDLGWRCVDPTQPGALSDLLSDSSNLETHLFWWRDAKGLLITWDNVDEEKHEVTMGVGVMGCELDDMTAFLMDVKRLAAAQKKDSVFWIAPVHERVEMALQQAGYSSDWDNTTFIFEKRHPQN